MDVTCTAVNVPCTPEFRSWLKGLADRVRATQAGAIDKGLELLAGSVGYPGPPMRTPGRGRRDEPAAADAEP